MSWCDKLASTPSAGFRLDNHFVSGDSILSALAPMLDKWIDGEKALFNIEKRDHLSVDFTTTDGFRYGVDSSRIHVAFIHRMKVKAVSGAPPIMEMLSKPAPYTSLASDVMVRLIDTTLLLPNINNRKVTRVGFVTTTRISQEEAPPGIRRFIEYLGKPWQQGAESFDIQITAGIGKTSNWSDRCIHILRKPEDSDELPTLQFDWQRTFSSGRPTSRDSLKELVADAHKASLEYFEDLAEGSRFDEQLIGGSN